MQVDMKCHLTFYPRRRLGIISTLANGIKLRSRTRQEAEESVLDFRRHIQELGTHSEALVSHMAASKSAWWKRN